MLRVLAFWAADLRLAASFSAAVHNFADARPEHVFDLTLQYGADPHVANLSVLGCKDKPALGVVPVFFSVLPCLGFHTSLVILSELFLNNL